MYRLRPRRGNPYNVWLLPAVIAVLLFIGGVWVLHSWYSLNLRPVSSSTASQYFTVESGSSVHQISTKLKSAGLIRSVEAFETYVRSNQLHNKLQAGTYSLSPSMTVGQIVKKMANGDVARNLLTILPGKRLDEIKETFKKAGYSQDQIDKAFNPAAYAGHPALSSLPAGASLEGYLYPDSFQKEVDTPAEVIIRQSLDEMQKHLTPDVIAGFSAQGLNVFQGITLASIVAQESDNPGYQATVAQVFLSRIKQDMALESNVTANYAADLAHQPRSIDIESPYNTYKHKGLPPGPISNPAGKALEAAAHPSNTDWLFFVAGDDGKVYFSRTSAEHDALVKQYCHKKCGQ